MRVRLLAILLLALLLGACEPAPREHKVTLMVFGTLVTITLWDVEPELADAAIATLAEDLDYLHSAWHAWQPGAMGRTNMLLQTTGEFTANPSVLPLLHKARELAPQSQGLFNPAIGKLVALWGFHGADLAGRRPPAAEAIAELLAQNPQLSDLDIDGIRIRNLNPALQLDMGAIAKGMAVERAIDTLRSLGIRHALVNAGGDLKASGQRGERAWRIGIRHPRQSCEQDNLAACMIAFLNVHDGEAVFTSGDYERYFDYAGRRYHHILDPRSGYPADQTTSVTVIHADAATADAAATALFIAGPAQWPAVARAMGIEQVMLIDKQGGVQLSPQMAQRIEWAEPPAQLSIKPVL